MPAHIKPVGVLKSYVGGKTEVAVEPGRTRGASRNDRRREDRRQREPPSLEETQPALAAYVAEQLDNLADEDRAFGLEERAQVERALAAATAALGDAVRQPS